MKRILRLLMAVLLFQITAGAFAQQTGIIRGRIIDENNLPMPGASVYIESIQKGTVSDSYGAFTIVDVPEGNYELTVSYIGFLPKKAKFPLKPEKP